MQESRGPTDPPWTTYINANPDIWIQLGEESRQTNAVLVKTIKQLHAEMINLRTNNERLREEQ